MLARLCLATRALALLLGLAGFACSSSDSSRSAPPPPPPPPPGAPAPAAAPGTSPGAPGSPLGNNPLATLQALGAAAQQLSQAGQASPGPVVNWRELAAFVPDTLGGFKARGEVDGSTTTMQGMQVSRVERRYEQDKARMRVEVLDTSFAPFLRVPFALAAAIQEDSSKGYKRGTSIKGQPALVEWQQRGRSEAHVLAGQRFVVNIEVDAATQGAAEAVAEAFDVGGLAALAARAQAQPGGPVPPPIPPASPVAPPAAHK
jgi:hypothetical protein